MSVIKIIFIWGLNILPRNATIVLNFLTEAFPPINNPRGIA
jgi:hypothetical protein